ncbi:hypothetical protein [Actinoplanes xinjiangensis]|uniref:Phosphotransferase family enzyme n=1 Tax=Actinoplanes xinjiangensis TaxID=512350 RepID=A0A316EU24_9ACTN|nr:hypothetical protein [Actinoplanes xinjiangensis]PWK36144.1 hypothetical protein BC793_124125 [Actinoplanes xinjiangensis]GIF42848.1 hypothetical protein Axi01nite_71590 [Actinoplanes xinjiangensis]
MPHTSWHSLPAEAHAAIHDQIGPVTDVEPVEAGSVADVVAILHTSTGESFCAKGARDDNPRAWMQRREARLNPYMPAFAPRLRWQVEAAGWSILGFDRAPGRHIDVTPGSPDLGPLAATLTAMSTTPAPAPPVKIQAATARWAEWVAPELVDGDTLVHTDVTTKNFLIHDGTIAVVDWAIPCRGADWLDTALMAIRLIRAGHIPAEAACWAEQVPAWRTASPEAVRAFAVACAALGAERARQSPAPHLKQLADAAANWASALGTCCRPATSIPY